MADRAASRLLRLDRQSGKIDHLAFRDLPSLLQPGDLVVMNETRVTAVRLFGRKSSGAQVEALLLREVGPRTFLAIAKPGRALRPGTQVSFAEGLEATVVAAEGLNRTFQFSEISEFERRLHSAGEVPLPPYIRTRLDDPDRYQTVYATGEGSAAAPTAGLHFTFELLAELNAKGVRTAKVSLDVGTDTFAPLRNQNLEEHKMHGEVCRVPDETARLIAECRGRVIAVGTTTVRTLESFAAGQRKVSSGRAETKLFIRSGYEFQVVDGIVTNFHLPRTTMLVMLSAFAGREYLLRAYCAAVAERYRFLSFGDAMVVL